MPLPPRRPQPLPSRHRQPLRPQPQPQTRRALHACRGWLVGLWLAGLALAASAQGITVAIGGALQDGNDAVWARLVQLAGGPGARFAVFATAAGDPDRSAAQIAANLARHGAVAEHIRVAPRLAGQDLAQAVQDPKWLAAVRASRGVFFSGGAQARLLDTLQPGGLPTPLLQAVRAVWAAGGVVAGTSSGAAVLSAVAFRDAPDPLAVMKAPATRLRDGEEIDRGFGFLPAGLAVDQHFIRRGRIARLLPLMQTRGLKLGIGVEEDSAVVVRGDAVEVVGRAGALVVDLHDAEPAPAPLPAPQPAPPEPARTAAPPFALQGARLHWLQPGDTFALDTRRASPGPAARAGTPLDRGDPAFRGYHEGPARVNDILAEGALVRALARLVDSDQTVLQGLAFAAVPAADDPAPALGFEWQFSVAAGTRGWHTGGETYTLIGVNLAIVPVRMASPLFQPWPAPTAPPR